MISNSAIRGNTYDGITVLSGGAPEIRGNDIRANGDYGISYSAASGQSGAINIHDNALTGNGPGGTSAGGGIQITGASNAITATSFARNSFAANTGEAARYDIGTTNALPSDIASSTLSKSNPNTKQGIFLQGRVAANATWGGGPFVALGNNTGSTSLKVDAGATLTLQPGISIKGSLVYGPLIVNGTLNAQGTAANPITFSSWSDDSDGYDTNGDGPSQGRSNVKDWDGITINATSGATTILDHTRVSYADEGVVINGGASPTISNSELSHNQFYGIQVSAGGAPPIHHDAFSANGDYGVWYSASSGQSGAIDIHDNVVTGNGPGGTSAGGGIQISGASNAITGTSFASNSFAGNTGEAARYDIGTSNALPPDISSSTLSQSNPNTKQGIFLQGRVAANATWGGGPFVALGTNTGSTSLKVDAGVTLTLQPGTSIKGSLVYGSLIVNGTLDARGTAASPITFSSWSDDSDGYDTNGDGPSQGRINVKDWDGITINGTSGATTILDHTRVSYADEGVVINGGASPTISNSELSHNQFYGIQVNAGGAPPIHHDAFSDNGDYGISYSAAGGQSGAINIHDNVVTANGPGGTAAAGGIQISGASNTITGTSFARNSFAGNTGEAARYDIGTSNALPPDISSSTLSQSNPNTKQGIFLQGRVAANATWSGGPFVVLGTNTGTTSLKIDAGATLTLQPGTSIKGANTYSKINVNGQIYAQGSGSSPVVFTSLADDSDGSDSNGDGPSTGLPGAWGGITFPTTTQGGLIDSARVSYASANVTITCPCTTPPVVRNSELSWASGAAARVDGDGVGTPSAGAYLLQWDRFHDNGTAIGRTATVKVKLPSNDYGSASGPKPAGDGQAVDPLVNWRPATVIADPAGPCFGFDNDCGQGADPVVMSTGALTYTHTDLVLTNKGAPLTFSRSYNSSNTTSSGIGPGWSQAALTGAYEQPNGDVIIVRTDGRQDRFKAGPPGYTPSRGVRGHLTKTTSGYTLVENGYPTSRTAGLAASPEGRRYKGRREYSFDDSYQTPRELKGSRPRR